MPVDYRRRDQLVAAWLASAGLTLCRGLLTTATTIADSTLNEI